MPRPRKPTRLDRLAPSGPYYIVWHDGTRDRRRSTGTRSREEAERALAEHIAQEGRASGPITTIGDVLAAYAETVAIRHASPATTAYSITHLATHLGDEPASPLPADLADRYAAARRRARAVSDATLRRELGVLVAALNAAGLPSRLPLPPSSPGRDRWLTPEEARALLDAATGHVKLFILLALSTGARAGALLDLRWGQIDLDQRLIYLNPPGRTQTRKKRPAVPMGEALAAVLAAARSQAAGDHVIALHGRPVASVKTGFRAAVKRAGLAGVTPHTLRHTVGTWAAQAGRPLHEIAGLLGHSSARTTELYAHHHADYLRAASAAIEGRLAGNLRDTPGDMRQYASGARGRGRATGKKSRPSR